MPTLEEQFYEAAAHEVAEKNLSPAIWGKAFSEAMGDYQKALALYIKFRVVQLLREHQQRQNEIRKDAFWHSLERIWTAFLIFCLTLTIAIFVAIMINKVS